MLHHGLHLENALAWFKEREKEEHCYLNFSWRGSSTERKVNQKWVHDKPEEFPQSLPQLGRGVRPRKLAIFLQNSEQHRRNKVSEIYLATLCAPGFRVGIV